MSLMTNPMEALLSYQQTLRTEAPLSPSDLDANYLKRNGEIAGAKRFDYVKIVDGEVQPLAMFVEEDPYNGVARFSLAYAVSENHRGRGLTVEAINKGIQDFKMKFGRVGAKSFYVEALIDKTNTHSINIAKQVLPGTGVDKEDSETGTPSLLFYKRILT